jgi:IclR family transcriptional regulator, KDG regulon repressor
MAYPPLTAYWNELMGGFVQMKSMSARAGTESLTKRRKVSIRSSKPPLVRIVSLALESIEILSKQARGKGVRELARDLQVGKSTAHRILQTLEAHKLARQDSETGRYVITARLIRMAALIQSNLDFQHVARPFLAALQKRCGETVYLGVLDSQEVVIVDRIDSAEPLRLSHNLGFREPVHSTALGKALLAALTDADLDSMFRDADLNAMTPKTTTSLGSLKSELKRVRLSGFAIDDEETWPGVRCVGAPVHDASGGALCAVSVSGPSVRITPERIASLAQEIRTTAESISSALGFKESGSTVEGTAVQAFPHSGFDEIRTAERS